MKKLMIILCWLLVGYCIYFPCSYYNSPMNKKEVKSAHILVDTEEQAQKIRQEILDGKKFEDAAKEYSTCDSKDIGGNLHYSMRGVLVPEVENAIFNNLKLKELSQPIKSIYGWHIIKVDDIKYFSEKDGFGIRY